MLYNSNEVIMNLLQFIKEYPTEEVCLQKFVDYRLQRGITCPKCNEQTKQYWLAPDKKFKCKKCLYKTSYKSGTLMEKSKIDIQTWFMLIHLMTSIKKSLSALEVSRQLDARYDTVWYAMHKIRSAMGKRDAHYSLNGTVEIDDAFFVAVDLGRDKEEEIKRGRGSQRQAKVLVMVESEAVSKEVKIAKYGKDTPHKKDRKMGYVKMIVVDDLSGETINNEASKGLDSNVSVIADDWKGYRGLGKVVAKINQMVVPPKQAMDKLPWVHTVISNAKKMTAGVHHSVAKEYLQNYLNEFCWKINRRGFNSDPFERAMCMAVDEYWC
jgi:transposase-like protein